MDIKYAVFDFDGTLGDSLGFWEVMWEDFGLKFFSNPAYKPDPALDKKLRTTILPECAKLLSSELGIATPDEIAEILSAGVWNYYKTRVVLKPGVSEFLNHCAENGVKMCIASASEREIVEFALKNLKVDNIIPKVISCVDLKSSKDRPDVYYAALEYLGSDPSETWVFEDSLTALKTAKSIGMKTVGIYDRNNYGHEELEKEADIYIGENETMLKIFDI